jgi:hypothetical protein
MKIFLETRTAKTLYFILGLAIIVLAMSFVMKKSKLAASMNSPQLYFQEMKHDFGKVPQGPQLQYNFKFKNTGAQPLIIDHVQTSCGCTGATIGDKKEYASNESGEISVTFNTQGREGKQEKTIIVYSNDVSNPTKTVAITCEIDPAMK